VVGDDGADVGKDYTVDVTADKGVKGTSSFKLEVK